MNEVTKTRIKVLTGLAIIVVVVHVILIKVFVFSGQGGTTDKKTVDQAPKVAELVNYLKKYPKAKVVLTGYADKATGNAYINARLAEKRAATVSQALQAEGIAADRITTDSKGDTVQPFEKIADNRVTICIAEE